VSSQARCPSQKASSSWQPWDWQHWGTAVAIATKQLTDSTDNS
jgi:hypothetical protein